MTDRAKMMAVVSPPAEALEYLSSAQLRAVQDETSPVMSRHHRSVSDVPPDPVICATTTID